MVQGADADLPMLSGLALIQLRMRAPDSAALACHSTHPPPCLPPPLPRHRHPLPSFSSCWLLAMLSMTSPRWRILISIALRVVGSLSWVRAVKSAVVSSCSSQSLPDSLDATHLPDSRSCQSLPRASFSLPPSSTCPLPLLPVLLSRSYSRPWISAPPLLPLALTTVRRELMVCRLMSP